MISNEHKNYLKKRKKEKILVITLQISIILFFIITWQLLVDFKIINAFISSSPKGVIETIINLHKAGNLYQHIITTVFETFISFTLGIIIGTIIATILWWNKFISRVLDPYLTVLNSLPKVALGPIIIIWIGANTSSIVVMALLISVIVTIINIHQGFDNTDKIKIRLMKSFKANNIQIFTKLILPSNFPNIISTLKINASMSLIGVIMGEFLVSKKGIGYLIMYGSQVFNLNLVMTGIVILGIVSAVMYYIIYYIEKLLIKNK